MSFTYTHTAQQDIDTHSKECTDQNLVVELAVSLTLEARCTLVQPSTMCLLLVHCRLLPLFQWINAILCLITPTIMTASLHWMIITTLIMSNDNNNSKNPPAFGTHVAMSDPCPSSPIVGTQIRLSRKSSVVYVPC